MASLGATITQAIVHHYATNKSRVEGKRFDKIATAAVVQDNVRDSKRPPDAPKQK